ncbi:MAG: tetratricopeptide repeat protein [Planctomycetes bacterium]|nr:tetratricopeptide repeat protein [Planctomycetota bacterium]
MDLIHRVRQLYESNRFLDAYADVRDIWTGRAWVEAAGPEELLWASRLAGRLGGGTLGRVLLRTAMLRFADHPAVRVDGRWLFRRRRPLLGILEEALACPALGSGDAQLDAHWLVDAAFFWSLVRDFPRAHHLLDQAAADHGAADSWFHSTRAQVLFCEDRWEEALQEARLSWEISPNKPAAGAVLVRVLLRLGRLDEAIERLKVAADGQSFEMVQLLAWVLCAKAERSPREARLALAAEADRLCGRLEDLSPLRGRPLTQLFAAARFDVAMLAEDPQAMRLQASVLTLPLYQQISRNLDAAPGGTRRLLNYRAVFQKQDRCLPTSIASIAGTFGHTIDADALAKELTYNGTPIWRALGWLREHGYAAKVFVLTKDLCRDLLVQGLPFVYTFNTSLDDSHATAAVGIDEDAGLLLYHDPAAERFGRILLDHVGEVDHPLGPWGLAFVPADRAALLEGIGETDARLGELCQQFRHTAERGRADALAAIVREMEQAAPQSPVTEAYRAQWHAMTHQLSAGIAALEDLCARYPRCIDLQRMLLFALDRTRNTARIREFLDQKVRRGRMPGVSDTLPWRYPPSSCVSRYADIVGLTADGAAEARDLLLSLLERESSCATAYHVLGDVYIRQGQLEQASLPYRVASLLGRTDEHFARATFDALRLVGRGEEGLAYLRQRVGCLGTLVDGGPPWATLITALEDGGDIDTAAATAEEALAARGQDAGLLAFLTQFWVRMGRWDTAQALLDRLEACDNRDRYLEAAVRYYHAKGQWRRALDLCREWAAQSTDPVEPHRMLASLMRNAETVFAVVQTARQWAKERPDDEGFEFIYYDQLRAVFRIDEQEAFIRARLRRNAQDTWAWRELAHLLIGRAECLDAARREPVLRKVEKAVRLAVRLAPHEADTLFLQARLAEVQGRWKRSIVLLLEGLSLQGEVSFAYGRAWENSANLPREVQEEVLRRLEERLLRSVGPLHTARYLALGVAARFGADSARACVERWIARRPGDPELIEAYADVLVQFGQGRTDAARAAEALNDAMRHYPQHLDLRLSLAEACGAMLQYDRRRKILREALASWPLDSRMRSALASDLAAHGKHDEAMALLKEGIRIHPQDPACWLQMARTQSDAGTIPAAINTLRQAIKLLPENVMIRGQLASYLCQVGQGPEAMKIVRDGLNLYPDSAAFQHMLADTMINGGTPYDVQDAEAALRKALEFNHAYYEAADLLACLLASRHRFDEAEAVIRTVLPKLSNAATARGRLAWLTWVRGSREQAVDQMAEALEAHPNYSWGWWTLMGWLEELETPDLTCRLLERVPPAVSADPALTARRLELLGRAALSSEKLDAAWSQALADFPLSEDLLVRRVDVLTAREDWDGAEALIAGAAPSVATSPYVLARKVRLAVHRNEPSLAIGAAMEIFRRSQDAWPQWAAWQCLLEGGLYEQAVETILDDLAAGLAFQTHALCTMVEHVDRITGSVVINGRSYRRQAAMHWLAGVVTDAEWDRNHEVLGAVLEALNTWDRAFVAAFLRKNEPLCRSHTRLWQAIAHHLATGRFWQRLRQWIADWRQRQSAEMVTVSYYRSSFGADLERRPFGSSRKPLWQSICQTSRDALDRLPQDHTVLFHVAALCEGLLALGRTDEFLRTAERYRTLLESPPDAYWLPDWYRHESMVPRLRRLADLMACEDPARAPELFVDFCHDPRQPLLYAAAFDHLKRWFGYPKRLALSLGLLGPKGYPKGSLGRILTILSLILWPVPVLGPAVGIGAVALVQGTLWNYAAALAVVLGVMVTMFVLGIQA